MVSADEHIRDVQAEFTRPYDSDFHSLPLQFSITLTSIPFHDRPVRQTFASLTPPLALLASLSCFTLRLKPRKTGFAFSLLYKKASALLLFIVCNIYN
jgi:hypothetical protein